MLQSARGVLARHAGAASTTTVAAAAPQQQQRRSITSKHARVPTYKPSPWPYREIGYTQFHGLYDGTLKRIDENSRILLVEGNIGSGKSTVAKKLAEEFDFLHIPEYSMESVLIGSTGIDRRDFYHVTPTSFQLPDMRMYYEETDKLTKGQMAQLCVKMLFGRSEQMMNAIAHMLNTGQGVVLERSAFSDFVFVNAMRQKNLISKQFFRYYHHLRAMLMNELKLKPHLCIYLDKPVDACLESIKKRGRPEENNTALLDREYLTTIENSYKDMLSEMRQDAMLLVYDWQYGDDAAVDRLIEDVEKTDLNFYEAHSMTQMRQWFDYSYNAHWSMKRYLNTSKDSMRMWWRNHADLHMADVHELNVSIPDRVQMEHVIRQHLLPGNLAYPYNAPNKNWRQILSLSSEEYLAHLTPYPSISYLPWYEHFHKDMDLACFHAAPWTLNEGFNDDAAYDPKYLQHAH